MDTERLRYAVHCHAITETLQGFDGPLAVTFLLFGSLVRVALLLIIGPLPGQMIHDDQNLMPHCHCGTFATNACFEAPESSPQKRRGFAGAPRTLHQNPPQVPVPFARTGPTTGRVPAGCGYCCGTSPHPAERD